MPVAGDRESMWNAASGQKAQTKAQMRANVSRAAYPAPLNKNLHMFVAYSGISSFLMNAKYGEAQLLCVSLLRAASVLRGG